MIAHDRLLMPAIYRRLVHAPAASDRHRGRGFSWWSNCASCDGRTTPRHSKRPSDWHVRTPARPTDTRYRFGRIIPYQFLSCLS